MRDVLTGKITNWKEVGEKERPIIVARPHCTDREGNWKQIVPDKKLLAKGRIDVKEDQDALLAVKDNENSIGFIGLNMVNPASPRPSPSTDRARGVAHRRDVPVGSRRTPSSWLSNSSAAKKFVDFHSGRREKAPPLATWSSSTR